MHWLTEPGTSASRGEAHLGTGLPRPARDPGRAQLRLAHRAGAPGRRDLRRRLRRELDQRRPGRRLRPDARRGPPDRRGLPGPLPRRADLPARAHQGGADRHERVDRRAHLRPGPDGPAREGRRDREADRRGRRGRSTRTRTSQEDLPHVEVELDLAAARGYGLKPGRRAARSRRPCSRARRSATSSAAGRPTTSTSGASLRARQPHRRRSGSRSTPRRRARAPRARSRTCASPRLRTASSASASRGGSTWAPTSRVVTSPRSWTTSRTVWRASKFPRGYHAKVVGESTELNAAQDRLLVFGIAAALAIFLLLQAAFGSLRLALLTFLTPADGARGRSARGMAGRRGAVARLARGLPHGLRHRGAERHPDDQPLPAPRAQRG